MVASISSSTVTDWSNALFSKLDTKQQGYIDKADLQAAFAKTANITSSSNATGAATNASGTSDADVASKLFDQLDSDKNGQVSKSELSSAIEKLADELNAQLDQSRVEKSGGARHAGPPPGGGGHGGAAPTGDADSATTTQQYNAAADTDSNGTVSAEEAAAYAKLIAGGGDTAKASDGLSKEALTKQLDSAGTSTGSVDSRRQQALSSLVENFDKADSDGDGKLTRKESHDFLKANRPAAQTQPEDANRALAKALEMLKAYVDSGNDSQSASAQSVSTSA
jgi:Ca2+-binding EF-hand superfamily protein